MGHIERIFFSEPLTVGLISESKVIMKQFTGNQDGVEARGRYHWATVFNRFLMHPHASLQNLSDCHQDYPFKDGCRVTLENGDSVSSYS